MKTPTQVALEKAEREAVRLGHQSVLFRQLDREGLHRPVPEYQFHEKRKWKIDFAWTIAKVALEVEGGVYKKGGGGHRSISGFDANLEKYNELAVAGWRLIRVTPDMLEERNGKAIEILKRIIAPIESFNEV